MALMWSVLLYSIVIFVMTVATGRISTFETKSIRYSGYTLISGIASLVPAFRGLTGTDTAMYKTVYLYGEAAYTRWSDIEKGYIAINNFFQKFLPLPAFFFLVSFVTIYLYLLSIDSFRDRIDMYVAAFILFTGNYLLSMNIMRQMLAVSICLFAMVKYLEGKKILPFVLFIIATNIHTSAVLCVLFIVLDILLTKYQSRSLAIIIVAVVLLLTVNYVQIGNIILRFTGNKYYAGYFTRSAFTGGSFISYYLKNSPILIVICLYIYQYRQNRPFFVMFVALLVGYMMASIGAVVDTQVGRIGYYFTAFSSIVLGFCSKYDVILQFDGRNIVIRTNVIKTMVYIYYILNLISMFGHNYAELLPYGLS